MGKVFSLAQVLAGSIPEMGSYNTVAATLRDALTTSPYVVGAVAYGSYVKGTHNQRSDLDCLALIESDSIQQAHQMMGELKRHAALLHVPLNLTCVGSRHVLTEFHHIGWGYYQVLKEAVEAGHVIKYDPIRNLKVDHLTPQADAVDYFRFKLRQLDTNSSDLYSPDSARFYRALKKGLENPYHAARKWLNFREIGYDDSHRGIVEQFCEYAPIPLRRMLEHLDDVDSIYTFDLFKQIGNPDEPTYVDLLNTVITAAWTSYTFVQDCAVDLAHAH